MSQRNPEAILAFGPFRLDRARGCLLQGEKEVALRLKSWETLVLLAENAGTVISYDVLYEAVWPGVAVTPKTLTNVIVEIRRALGDNSDHPTYIETVHRRGYRFLPQPQAVAAAASIAIADADFVGRAAEIRRLLDCWQQTLANQRQIVFICGEAGIGKSTLVEALLPILAGAAERPLIGAGHCIERHGAHEAYMPVLEAIAAYAAAEPSLVTALLREFAPTWLAQIPWLVPENERQALESRLPAGSSARMLREGTRFLEALAEHRPVVLVLEDLHWSDPESIDFVAAAGRSRVGSILLIGTYRPVEARISAHPVASAASTLVRAGAHQIIVEPFTRGDVTEYLRRRLADVDAAAQAAAVVEEHSRGIPLLVCAVVDHMIAQRAEISGGARWRLPQDAQALLADLPHSVRDVIEVQVERLQPADLEMLEVASVVGQKFTVENVGQALGIDPQTVADSFARLSRQATLIEELVSSAGNSSASHRCYGFVHTLYQMTLYDRVPQYQRQRLHQRIGEQFEASGGASAVTLATHFERSGDYVRAVHYLEEAAYAVSRRAASRDAVAYVRRALELEQLAQLSGGAQRAEPELRLQVSLGLAAAAVFGADSQVVKQAAARSLVLCSSVDEPRTLFSALHSLWLFALLNGDARVGSDLVSRTTALAEQTGEPLLRMLADVMVGTIACFAGWPAPGRERLERALAALPELRPWLPRIGLDIEVEIRLTLGWALWLVGFPDQALRSAEVAVNIAAERQDPNACTLALVYMFNVHHLRGEHELAGASARELQALGNEFDLDLPKRTGLIMEAAALMEVGKHDDAVIQLMQSGASEDNAGVQQIVRTYYLGRVALACGRVGAPEQGLNLVAEALQRIERNGLATSEAEIRRIQGELLQQVDRPALAGAVDGQSDPMMLADECFGRAIELARRQSARAWELRATVSRARLWQRQGRAAEAHQALSLVYDQFSEGLDTADLREARQLIDQLQRP